KCAGSYESYVVLFGLQVRGDELPPVVRDRTGRGERITAALGQIEARRRAAERARRERAEQQRVTGHAYEEQAAAAGGAPGVAPPPIGRPPKSADPVVVTRARLDRALARARASQPDSYGS